MSNSPPTSRLPLDRTHRLRVEAQLVGPSLAYQNRTGEVGLGFQLPVDV